MSGTKLSNITKNVLPLCREGRKGDGYKTIWLLSRDFPLSSLPAKSTLLVGRNYRWKFEKRTLGSLDFMVFESLEQTLNVYVGHNCPLGGSWFLGLT